MSVCISPLQGSERLYGYSNYLAGLWRANESRATEYQKAPTQDVKIFLNAGGVYANDDPSKRFFKGGTTSERDV